MVLGALLAMAGLMVSSQVRAQTTAPGGDRPACGAAEKAGCAVCKGGMKMKMMPACAAKMDGVSKALEAAKAAVEKGDKEAALAELAKAQAMLAECHKMMAPATQAQTAPAGIVNKTCPIMGSKLDPAKVPGELTRVFRGQKVGFCCAGCPVAWDKLTDEQKQAALDKSR
ncbi:MAG TPA: hypothetical protein DCX07_03095 [Phycisphaerales bacterium]|nr:hypothetical protein [Phycisphaerales bacterium]